MALILLAEDDYYLGRDLKLMLEHEGYQVLAAGSVKEAVQLFLSAPVIDLFLLDYWLPDGDGFLLLSKIRERSHAPILFLTACDDEQTVSQGLDAGADDYILKPFRKAELISRIRANLRRRGFEREQAVMVSGTLRLDPFSHEVSVSGVPVKLRPTEYRLLLLFMENPGLLFSRERLVEALSEDDPEYISEDNVLNVEISRLRKALPPGLIETVRGFGYRFVGEVRKL